MVYSFLGTIIDRLCNLDSSSITKRLALYVGLLKFEHRRRMRSVWTESDLQTLFRNIDPLNVEGCRVLTSYQWSKMRALNFHLVQNLLEDLQSVGSIDYLLVRFYDILHESFIKAKGSTSKKCKYAMHEVKNQDVKSEYEKGKIRKPTLSQK